MKRKRVESDVIYAYATTIPIKLKMRNVSHYC